MADKITTYSRRALFLGLAASSASSTALAATNCDARERFIVFKVAENDWRWRLCSGNGQQIAEHKQRYNSKQACKDGIRTVQRYHKAPIVDEDGCGADCKKY